jgi:hypothetical protein
MSVAPQLPAVVSTEVAVHIVELACRAPSVHNTQPWSWRVAGNDLELCADLSRHLPVEDPQGRNLVISCGAALHHSQVAARAFGWVPLVDRFPDGPESTLLARIHLDAHHRSASSVSDLKALRQRHTDRRRFTAWPVSEERLDQLASTAAEWDTNAIPVTDITARLRLELLVSRALSRQASDPAVLEEQRNWVDRGGGEGVPYRVVPAAPPPPESYHSRFGPGLLDEPERDVESSDGLIVLGGPSDDPGPWLRTGEGLSALWLSAAQQGLSVVPLSQVIEVPETRAALQHDVMKDRVVPHLLVRLGWQVIGRSGLVPTPRRPVDDVLVP